MFDDTPLGMNEIAYRLFVALKNYSKEDFWNYEPVRNSVEVYSKPYFNCRERGFVLEIGFEPFNTPLKFAFFEHRNVDCLCAVKFITDGRQKPFYTSEDIPEEFYKDKGDVVELGCGDHKNKYGEPVNDLQYTISGSVEWLIHSVNTFYDDLNLPVLTECEGTVSQTVPDGLFKSNAIDSPCGSTGHYGQRLLCGYCEKNPPKTWGDVHGYEECH